MCQIFSKKIIPKSFSDLITKLLFCFFFANE